MLGPCALRGNQQQCLHVEVNELSFLICYLHVWNVCSALVIDASPVECCTWWLLILWDRDPSSM